MRLSHLLYTLIDDSNLLFLLLKKLLSKHCTLLLFLQCFLTSSRMFLMGKCSITIGNQGEEGTQASERPYSIDTYTRIFRLSYNEYHLSCTHTHGQCKPEQKLFRQLLFIKAGHPTRIALCTIANTGRFIAHC